MNVRLLETLDRPEVKGQFGDIVDLPDEAAMALVRTGFAEKLSAAAAEDKSAGPPAEQSARPAPVSKAESSKHESGKPAEQSARPSPVAQSSKHESVKSGRHAPKKSRKAPGK